MEEIMAGRPPFDQFDADSEDIESYLERLQEYFTTYDIADDEAMLLCSERFYWNQ